MSLKIKHRYNPANLFKSAAVFFSCFSLAFLAGSLSFISRESSAEDNNIGATGPDSSIALAVNSAALDLSVDPSSGNTEAISDVDVIVDTNNSDGYTLSMSVGSSTTGLTHANGITTVPSTSNLSPAALGINTWGYSVGSSAIGFVRVPGLGAQTTLKTTAAPSESSSTIVTFGAKVDATRPAGVYSNTIEFTAVSNL